MGSWQAAAKAKAAKAASRQLIGKKEDRIQLSNLPPYTLRAGALHNSIPPYVISAQPLRILPKTCTNLDPKR